MSFVEEETLTNTARKMAMWMTTSGLGLLLTVVAAIILLITNQKIANIQVKTI